MATVYLAEDTKHHRSVALKVLRADLAAYLGPERFKREIAVAAKLQHPHILSVYDSGETATGLLWYTMPYVEGESLRERLQRDKQLSVEEAIRITQGLAGALDYAHQHGVLHRDIKPENVLLTRQRDALLADFGIARALGSDTSGGAPEPARTSLTATGLAVGTPQYMSPEQASAERDLTVRSDIYSLGAMVYEMLVGEPPFTGPTPQVVLAKMVSGEVPSVRRSRPTVQVAIDAALRKALAPVPADRWDTAGEFAAALESAARTGLPPSAPPDRSRRVPVAALTLTLGFLLGVGVLFAWRARTATDGAGTDGPVRVAVLPFDNLGDTADAYFADGLTDAVRSKLTAIRGLEVIASTSSGQYRRTTKSPREIAQELGVRYLLVGKVRWAKAPTGGTSRVQVSPELIDASTAADKWSAPFDAPLADVFQVQADIAGEVAQQLKVALTPTAQQTLVQRPTGNLDAYDAYLRGRDMGRRSAGPTALRQVAAAYREAIRLDSTFALAWSGLATEYALIYAQGTPLPALGDSAHAAATTALALAPNLPEAHIALGIYFLNVSVDYAQALAEDSAALVLAPNNLQALRVAAVVERRAGQWAAAERHLRQAWRLDPRDVGAASSLGELELWRRDYPAAQTALDRAQSLQPGNVGTLETRVMVALAQGDLPGARGIVRAALPGIDTTAVVAYLAMGNDLGWVLDSSEEHLLLSLGPAPFGNDLGGRALALVQQYAFRGDMRQARAYADTARAAFEAALKTSPNDAQQHAVLGLALAYLEHKEEAVREGERAVALRPVSKDPYFGPYLQHQLVRIYILVGEPEKALDALEPLLRVPYWLSPGWLRVDPNFAPLRGNPRFQRLIAQPATPPGA
jgi:eukaryotic-like serine/threonine-protein kinase